MADPYVQARKESLQEELHSKDYELTMDAKRREAEWRQKIHKVTCVIVMLYLSNI